MKLQEAVDTLKRHNEWRKGGEGDFVGHMELGIALDTVISFTEKVLGEPSEAMVEATITSFNNNGKLALVSHAKAYVNQARKEVEGVD